MIGIFTVFYQVNNVLQVEKPSVRGNYRHEKMLCQMCSDAIRVNVSILNMNVNGAECGGRT